LRIHVLSRNFGVKKWYYQTVRFNRLEFSKSIERL
jgi:hypothetical protein